MLVKQSKQAVKKARAKKETANEGFQLKITGLKECFGPFSQPSRVHIRSLEPFRLLKGKKEQQKVP